MPVAWFQENKRWVPPLVWYLCILAASSIPGDGIPEQDIPYLDKVVHLSIYAVLGYLLARTRVSFFPLLGAAALLGLLDELYQNLTPHRSPDPLDWIADVTGACGGILLARWFLNRKKSSWP